MHTNTIKVNFLAYLTLQIDFNIYICVSKITREMAVQFTRIAVKIGSNVLARKDGTLDVTRMSALVDQVAELRKAGVEVILISSGAVASGRSEIKPSKKIR